MRKKKKKERKIYNKKKLINFLRDSTLVNEFVINKWPAYLFQRVQLILERKNRKMYGISGILQLHLHFIAQCNVSELGSKDRTNQNGYYYPIMRDVLFSLFFLSLSPLSLSPPVSVLFSSVSWYGGMRPLCPRFLSFMPDSRRDVQRSCYNVAVIVGWL